jgi:hypothetical protein
VGGIVFHKVAFGQQQGSGNFFDGKMGCAVCVVVPAKNIVQILKGKFFGEFLQDFFFFWPLVLFTVYLDTINTNRKERDRK